MSKIRLFGTSSGYVEIAPAAAASNNTLTAPSTVGEIIAKDAAGAIGITSMKASNVNVGTAVTITESGIEASGIGITCANINGSQIGGRRNIIINGAMMVAQRGTSSTTSNSYILDRFHQEFGGTDEAPTYSQVNVSSGTSPYAEGFRKALRITNGNQTSGAQANDYIQLDYRPEAQDIANSGWNYTSASSFMTLSFWIKSSVEHNFQWTLRTIDGTSQSFQFRTGTLTADTWTKVVKKIPGNSNITFDNNNDKGFYLFVFPYIGTAYTSNSNTLDAWQASTGTSYGVPDGTTFWTTNDATMELTGVQFEFGSQATPFEHRSFAEELALCQRYYCHTYSYGTYPGSNKDAVSGARQGMIFSYRQRDNNYQAFFWSMPVAMRAVPTQTMYSMLGTAGKASGSQTDYTVNTNSPHNGSSGVMAYGTNPHADDGYVHFVLDAEL